MSAIENAAALVAGGEHSEKNTAKRLLRLDQEPVL